MSAQDDRPEDVVWVFGYGSLCWLQGFPYLDSVTGYVEGYSRKFWQGNSTHRGTPLKPGRVATLIEDPKGVTWGRAFLVSASAALPHLESREVRLGGYLRTQVDFNPLGSSTSPFPALLYLATPKSEHWLGEAPEEEIANQILSCSGPSGHNVEYLLRLADFMHEQIPWAVDNHLFRLEVLVREGLQQRERNVGQRGAAMFASMLSSKKLRCLSI